MMNYEQRKRMISHWLFETLKRYEAPAHFNESASREEMILMVEDINSEIPSVNDGMCKLLLERTAQHVRKNYTSRRWPTINAFIKGIKEHRERIMDEQTKELPAQDYSNSPLSYTDRIMVRRIKEGEAIPDSYLDPTSRGRQHLIEQGAVLEVDFEKYFPPQTRIA